jgi:hypothetical protein
VAKQAPNFTRLDPRRPDVAILIEAMLRARQLVATRWWLTSQKPITEAWWADVLADLRSRHRPAARPTGFLRQLRAVNVAAGLRDNPETDGQYMNIHPSELFCALAEDDDGVTHRASGLPSATLANRHRPATLNNDGFQSAYLSAAHMDAVALATQVDGTLIE